MRDNLRGSIVAKWTSFGSCVGSSEKGPGRTAGDADASADSLFGCPETREPFSFVDCPKPVGSHDSSVYTVARTARALLNVP